MYEFKSQCTPTNERFFKLECWLHSIQKNKSKTFPPLGNGFIPPFKNITLKNYHIIYPMEHNDLYDYDIKFIMSSGLIFYDIIIGTIINKHMFSTD